VIARCHSVHCLEKKTTSYIDANSKQSVEQISKQGTSDPSSDLDNKHGAASSPDTKQTVALQAPDFVEIAKQAEQKEEEHPSENEQASETKLLPDPNSSDLPQTKQSPDKLGSSRVSKRISSVDCPTTEQPKKKSKLAPSSRCTARHCLDRGGLMIQCAACKNWLHAKCLSLTIAKAKKIPKLWKCPAMS